MGLQQPASCSATLSSWLPHFHRHRFDGSRESKFNREREGAAHVTGVQHGMVVRPSATENKLCIPRSVRSRPPGYLCTSDWLWLPACYAAFPRCSAGSMPGEPSSYLRVCSNACNHYVKACGIECCDDSVQCVFEHEKQVPGLDLVKSSGFSSSSGPSSFCTGAAGRDGLSSLIIMSAVGIFSLAHSGAKFSMRSFKMFMYVLTVAATGCLLQGCDSGNQFDVDLDFPSHSVPVWRTSQDYWIKYQYLSEESAGPKMSKINSCADMASEGVRVCSGRGVCKLFGPGSDGLLFCECDSLYADPECGTERKSQLVVYALSLFLGFTGADLFYLGYPVLASLKLCSLGGLGFWWAYDIIRVGSSPVYADSYRVAQDLPHWAFVLTTVGVACCVGFIWAINSAAKQVRIKRTELLLAGSNC